MSKYIVERFIQIIPLIFLVTLAAFIIFQFLGNPVYSMLGPEATQQEIERTTEELGLNRPMYVQYFIFLGNIVRGDFGTSYTRHRSVSILLRERLPASIELALTATIVAVLFAIPIGVYTAIYPKSPISRVFMGTSLFGIAMPTFLLGVLLILFISVTLRWLPPSGRGEALGFAFFRTSLLTANGISHIILPAVTLSLYQFAMLLRLIRAAVMEEMVKDYARTARAKGLSNRVVYFKHVLRNALSSAITMVVILFITCLAYSIVVETIFQWPGLGSLIVHAIAENDQPIIVAYILFVAIAVIILNLLADILYRLLDPRTV